MKIAVISTMLGQPWTGSEELWAAMAQVALQKGHHVEASLWRWPSIPPRVAALQAAGAQITFRSRPGPLRKLYKVASQRITLPQPSRISAFRALLNARPDVICLSQGWVYEFRDNPDLVARLRASKIPLLVLSHANIEEPISEKMRRDWLKFMSCATRLAFVSQGNLRAAQRQNALPLENSLVVRNPVNLNDFSAVDWPEVPARESAEGASAEADFTWNMANVGRLQCASKGQDVLLEALSAPIWRERCWKLRFFGDGPDKEYLSALIKHYDLGEHVEFGGYVPDVRAIWKDHHLLVMPSRNEGTPLALVEAMWCARAALVTDVAGHLEWIEADKTGFVAESPSANSLFLALERAWQARHQWRAMGEAARETARRQYDPKPGESLLQILENIVASPQLSPKI